MIPFSMVLSDSKAVVRKEEAHFSAGSFPVEDTSQSPAGLLPFGKSRLIYPCNSSNIEHTLQWNVSSEGGFLSLPYSTTPHAKIPLKDRNLQILSPQAALQKVHELGLHNLVFVLKESKEGSLEAYLLPKLQGAMEHELTERQRQNEEILLQAKKQEIAELEHTLSRLRLHHGLFLVYQRRQQSLDLYIEELRNQIDNVQEEFLLEVEENSLTFEEKRHLARRRSKFSALFRKDPALVSLERNEEFYLREGERYFKQGDLERALESFTQVVEQNPRSYEAHRNLGALWHHKKKEGRAFFYYKKALEINSSDPELQKIVHKWTAQSLQEEQEETVFAIPIPNSSQGIGERQDAVPGPSSIVHFTDEQAERRNKRLLFSREKASSLRKELAGSSKDHPLWVIKTKLANFLEDPLRLGLREFKRAVEALETLPSSITPDMPWESFLHAYALFKDLCIERKELRELYFYSEKLTDGFLERRAVLDQNISNLIEEEFLKNLEEVRFFSRVEGSFLQEQPYLTLSLLLISNPSKQRELFLEGGNLALAFAESRQKEELAKRVYDEDYNKTASLQGYEDACAYFAAAYRLTTKCPELANKSLSAFEKLCRAQGKHLSVYMPKEDDERAAESYANGFKIRTSSTALSQLSSEHKQELAKEIENVADYLEAWGYSRLAYYIYDVLHEQFKKVPEVQAQKYQVLATNLGSASSVAGARERFLNKVQELGKKIENIRTDSSTLLSQQGISLEHQKRSNQRYRTLIRELFNTCSLLLDPRGQYPYALMQVGSLARDEMCPFSDFEVALVLEKEEHRAHFTKVAELFHLLVVSLGETKVSIIGKEEALPQGFSLDKYNNPLRLCHTADKLASRQKKKGEDIVQLNVLRSSSFLTGKKELSTAYHDSLKQALDTPFPERSSQTWRKKHALGAVKRACAYVDPVILGNDPIDIKEKLLRFCVFAFEGLCLYYALDTSCHTIEKIKALCAQGLFPQELQEPFEEYLSFAFGLRWKSHIKMQEEWDLYLLEPQEKERVVLAYHLLLQPLKETLEKWLEKHETSANPAAVLQDPNFFAVAYFEQAKIALSQGNLKQASLLAAKAASLKKDPLYLKLSGKIHFLLGEFCKAQEIWQENSAICTKKLLSLPSIPPFSTLVPYDEVNALNALRREWNEQEKLYLELARLAEEQDLLQRIVKEAHAALGNTEDSSPILEVSKWTVTLDKVEKQILDLRFNREKNFTLFIPFWQKSLCNWLKALPPTAALPELFRKVYQALPQIYRQEIQAQLVEIFPEKLPLLQDFFCNRGYIFSAEAKKIAWLEAFKEVMTRGAPAQRTLVEALTLPREPLSQDIVRALFQGREFKKGIQWGNRSVNYFEGTFFKKDPESPGDEYAVFLLNHLITGQGSPPVEVLHAVNEQPHLLLASQKVEGEPLQVFLSNYPNALSNLDKKQYSQMALMALIIDPEDGKADNYIARYSTSSPEKWQIIGIDNDHAFVKPFITKGIFFQEAQLFIKTILFCFDEMKEPFHPEVVEIFLQLDVTAVLEEWLRALGEYNKKVEAVFDTETKKTLDSYWQKEILLPFFMHPDQVLYLHEKMTRLQQALKPSQKVRSPLDLLKLLNPKVGSLYEDSFLQSPSPLQRFTWLTQNAYRREKGYSVTLTRSSQIKKEAFKESLKKMADFKEKGYIPEESLKILARMAEHQRLHEVTEIPLASLQENLRKLLTTPHQEELLQKLDWAQVPPSEVPHLLEKFQNAPLRKVHLAHCKALTDEHLARFIEGCKHPITEEIEIQRLNLQGCTSLTNKSLDAIKKCTRLKRLHLEGTNLETIELDKALSFLELINLKDCKKLTFLQIEGPLEKLILQGCTELQTLYLYCPKLKSLILQGVPNKLRYWASKETPLSESLYPVLKRAQVEEECTLTVPVSEDAMKVFTQAFKANTALKKLSIELLTKGASLVKPPTSLDLKGHPSLEHLHLKFPSLETLRLENTARLKVLIIENSLKLTNTAPLIRDLAGLKTLEELDLRGCGGLQGEQIEILIRTLKLERLTLPASLLDFRNVSGQSLLHLAVIVENAKLVGHLVSQGVDLSTEDAQGNDPLNTAMQIRDADMQGLLEKALQVGKVAFGRKDWIKYFGDVGEQPSLPEDIWEILQSSCPIWPNKKVSDTHLLTLIPQSVNGEPLTLNYLEKLVQNPKGCGNSSKYSYYDSDVKNAIRTKAQDRSYWVLLTKDVLPNTRFYSYEGQCEELENWKQKSPAFKAGGYRVPKALEVATSVLMEHVRSGTRFYRRPEGANGEWTYTRCSETSARGFQVQIGGFAASGLEVFDLVRVSHDDGVISIGSVPDNHGLGVAREV